MCAERLERRRAILGALAAALVPGSGLAAGRVPVGGSIGLHLPWPLGSIDPHRLDDLTAAIVGGALFESLYAAGADGAIAASLAEGAPEPIAGGLRVPLRSGIRTAGDRPIGARDAAWSISRARSSGARPLLAAIPPPQVEGHDALRFAVRDPDALVRALASPLVAVVPSGFAPERPDGTGPFAAGRRGDALVLSRNPRAAAGPAFLDEVVVRASTDVAASLRAFESGEDSIGWLGSGLHEPRPLSRAFDFGGVGWALLRTGRDAGAWDAPGVAQRLADGIPWSRLSYLVPGPAWPAQSEQGWGGHAGEVLVREDAPWLVEVARAAAATLSRPSHELSVRAIAPGDAAARRTSRAFTLMVDAVRPCGAGAYGALLGLSAADDPAAATELARHPPRLAETSPRALTRTLRVGVLAEVRVQGSRAAGLSLAATPAGGLDLGGASLARGAS